MVSPKLQGVFNSLRTYHGTHAPRAAMDAMYARFIQPGDLVFDIGAHVGDRVTSFRRLHARVVAVEPQPLPMRTLRLIHGRDGNVTLIQAAVAADEGVRPLRVNSANPTVSTVSDAFISEASHAQGWEGQSWDTTIDVASVTFDQLIARYGRPAFAKIDVEGYEDQVLQGLSIALPALSFEFTTIGRGVALNALQRLSALGEYSFNYALGETHEFVLRSFVDGHDMAETLRRLPHAANSGDVYAVLQSPARD